MICSYVKLDLLNMQYDPFHPWTYSYQSSVPFVEVYRYGFICIYRYPIWMTPKEADNRYPNRYLHYKQKLILCTKVSIYSLQYACGDSDLCFYCAIHTIRHPHFLS